MNAVTETLEMQVAAVPARGACSFRMEWQGVPEGLNELVPGGSYSLSFRPAFSRIGFIASLITSNLERGQRCALLTPLASEAFLQRCAESCRDKINDAIEKRQLLLFTLMEGTQKHIVRYGTEGLLTELEAAGVGQSYLLVIDQAEEVFTLHRADLAASQLQVFRQWLQRGASTALFLFSQLSEDRMLSRAHYALVDKMSGSAHLDYEHGEAELWVDFWQASDDMLAEHYVQLQDVYLGGKRSKATATPLTRQQPFAASGAQEPATARHDEHELHHLDTLTLPAGLFKRWKIQPASNLVGLVHATRQARHATVLIHVSRETHWPSLAQAVHAMRLQAGSMLRIIILDCGQAMRYQHEALLLRFGANLVLHAADALVRLPLMLESLQSTYHLASPSLSFEQALASATPPQTKGYLPPLPFINAVREALAQARVLSIPCALVMLPYSLTKDISSALTQGRLSREGDLLTIASSHGYLFLYGCVTENYSALLQRVLGRNSALPTEDLILVNDEDAILDTLNAIVETCTAMTSARDKPASLSVIQDMNASAAPRQQHTA